MDSLLGFLANSRERCIVTQHLSISFSNSSNQPLIQIREEEEEEEEEEAEELASELASCPRTTFENGQVTSEGHRSIRDLINWIYTEQCCPLRGGNTNHFPMSSGMGNLVVCYEPLIEFQFDDLVVRFTGKKGFV
ncbi:hypothetical protein V1477_015933 [Vespula maculifrons]|uniref:Uncharacterized protein n=1 Tax=Vespula maculifrons TaxID=7453 RepID=A0ABD2BBK4_VESMC